MRSLGDNSDLSRRVAELETHVRRLRYQNQVLGEALAAQLKDTAKRAPAEPSDWHALADDIELVLGGVRAGAGQFPECCSLFAVQWHGSGVLIAPRIVLTAAHCLKVRPSAVALRVASVPPDDTSTITQVDTSDFDPAFNGNGSHDLGYIKLATTPDNVMPVPLASTAEITAAKEVTLVGFGLDLLGTSHVKNVVTVDIHFVLGGVQQLIPYAVVEAKFDRSTEMLVGAPKKGAAFGDSGGPAYVQTADGPKLAGIISRGPDEAGGVTILERVDANSDWITKVLAGTL